MAKGDPKLTAEQHRKLVEKYNIHFDGPIPASSWPAQYVQVFRNIRDIARVRYEEYKPSERRKMITVAEMKDRVAKLNRIAHSCRKQRENEATWRGLTEPEIVSRFAAEVACPICKKRLWDSEFKALPDDPIRARELQKRRAKRALCRCSLETRAMEDIDQRGGARLFLCRLQTRFVHDCVDDLAKEGLSAQEPDRVFGLRDTKAFKTAASAYEGLKQSPFKDGKVLYPFLIIEAKSEKASPGFESIENQSAFPIRTLLKLQNDLNGVSERSMKPLVWFLANQGEEWRVYGGTFDDSKWRVIDLWHGTILSRDETLQLLLIVDYIYDWARDVYRRDILDCLKTEDVDMRDVTPAYTNSSSQPEELIDALPLPSRSIPRTTSRDTQSLIDLTLDSQEDDTDMEDIRSLEEDDDASLGSINRDEEDDESLTSTHQDDQHPLLRFSLSHNRVKPWNQHATIRHSNMVLFSFRHIAVPDAAEALGAWLDSFKAPEGRPQFSQMPLLRIIERCKAVVITVNGVLQLENLWTRTNHQLSSKNDDPILAWIWFHSYVRPEDWQVVRELRCVTVSKPAIINLKRRTGVVPSQGPIDWIVHRCHCLIADAQSLRSLCGKDSMISAAMALSLRLNSVVHANDGVHFGWVRCSDAEAEVEATGAHLWRSPYAEDTAIPSILIHHSSDLLEELLPGKVVPPSLVPHLRMRAGFGAKGAILLKKSFWQPASCPTYCLMVLDETDFDDEPGLGHKVIQVASIGDCYVGQFGGGFARAISPRESDKPAIELWADILCGKAADDAEWPLTRP